MQRELLAPSASDLLQQRRTLQEGLLALAPRLASEEEQRASEHALLQSDERYLRQLGSQLEREVACAAEEERLLQVWNAPCKMAAATWARVHVEWRVARATPMGGGRCDARRYAIATTRIITLGRRNTQRLTINPASQVAIDANVAEAACRRAKEERIAALLAETE